MRVRIAQLVVAAAIVATASACREEPAPVVPPQATPAATPPAGSPGQQQSPPPAAPAPPSPPIAPSAGENIAYQGPLPPLPRLQGALPRPPEVVRAVYEFAARQPGVLRYVPCFCGCERHGHGDNADCFVARRAADGRPTWDAHGMG